MKRFRKIRIFYILKFLPILVSPLVSRSQDCDTVKITDFPVKDLPSESDRTLLKDESPLIYYYGIGVKIDYVKARYLAFINIEKKQHQDEPLGGYSILMMLYANGFGVERNLDLSIRLACANVWGAQDEIDGRIQHLKDMKRVMTPGIFDICDDISSGLMDGECHSIRSGLADVMRKQKIDSVISHWTNQEKQAYLNLRKEADTFFDRRVVFEVDLTGTSRGAFQLDESDDLEDQFLSEILKANICSIKKSSQNEYIRADHELNIVYSKIKDNKTAIYGSITKDGVRKTQKSWILYRDAWVNFVSVKCPQKTSIYWKTMITYERINQLKSIVDNQ